MRRRQLRDQPQSQIQRLEHYSRIAKLVELGETVKTGEAAVALICDCAYHALEQLANSVRRDDPNCEFWTDEYSEAIRAAIRVAESVVPEDELDFYYVVDAPSAPDDLLL